MEAGNTACHYCHARYFAEPSSEAAQFQAPAAAATTRTLGPTRCRRRDGHVSRPSNVTLAGGYVSFTSGHPDRVALGELLDVRVADSLNGEHYSGAQFVVLRLATQEIGVMMTPDNARLWLDALGKRA